MYDRYLEVPWPQMTDYAKSCGHGGSVRHCRARKDLVTVTTSVTSMSLQGN